MSAVIIEFIWFSFFFMSSWLGFFSSLAQKPDSDSINVWILYWMAVMFCSSNISLINWIKKSISMTFSISNTLSVELLANSVRVLIEDNLISWSHFDLRTFNKTFKPFISRNNFFAAFSRTKTKRLFVDCNLFCLSRVSSDKYLNIWVSFTEVLEFCFAISWTLILSLLRTVWMDVLFGSNFWILSASLKASEYLSIASRAEDLLNNVLTSEGHISKALVAYSMAFS